MEDGRDDVRVMDDSGVAVATGSGWMDALARSLTGRPYVGSSDIMTTQELMDVSGVDSNLERADWRRCGSCRNGVEALRRPQVVQSTRRKSRKDRRRLHETSGKRGRAGAGAGAGALEV